MQAIVSVTSCGQRPCDGKQETYEEATSLCCDMFIMGNSYFLQFRISHISADKLKLHAVVDSFVSSTTVTLAIAAPWDGSNRRSGLLMAL